MQKLLLIGLLLLNFNFKVNAQMTTIYEAGVNTTDSLYGDLYWWMGGGPATGNGCLCLYIFNDGNYGITSTHENAQASSLYLAKSISQMADYGYLEFYVEYTLADPNSELSIFTSDSMEFQTTPNTCGNLVENSPLQMTAIPYYNTHQDSNLILQIHTSPVDSVVMNVSYIRVDVDLSSYMMFATNVDEAENSETNNNFNILPNEQGVKVSVASFDAYQVTIFNITGQEVYSEMNQGTSNISFKHEDGIYIVRIIDEQGKVYNKKVFLN